MKRFLYILLILTSFTHVTWSQGGAGAANIKTKGMYVYNFVKNVDWPSNKKTGDFQIGIMGDKELYNYMNSTYSGKVYNNQKIVISYIASFSDLEPFHLLYVDPSECGQLEKNKKTIKSNKTLIVTEKGGLLYSGSVINFIVANNKLAFEISKTNADTVPLTIGPMLLKMASAVI